MLKEAKVERTQKGVIAILLGVVLAIGWFDGQSFRNSPRYEKQNSANQQPNTKAPEIRPDERIADYTWWLAILTGALVAASIGQGYFLLRSDKTARMTAAAAIKNADTAEKALLAANNPIITITLLELRDPNEYADVPHIHWGLRNSGTGVGIVHTMFTRTMIGIKTPEGIKVARSKEEITWGSLIEPSDTASGFSITTPLLQRRVADIRSGKATLGFAIQANGQNLFEDRFSVLFAFQFNHTTNSFHRVAGSPEDKAQA